MAKGLTLIGLGGWILATAIMAALAGASPEPETMSMVGALALVANIGVALMLYRFRTGDANMRSVWICSRNDAIGNIAVMAAALGVFGTGKALARPPRSGGAGRARDQRWLAHRPAGTLRA